MKAGDPAREIYDRQARERQVEGEKYGRAVQLGGDVESLPQLQKARDQAGKAAGVQPTFQ